jgi:hypothetical protein
MEAAMRFRVIFIGSLAVISLGAIWLVSSIWGEPEPARRAPSLAARAADDAADLRAVKREVVALRSELARLDHQPEARPGSDAGPAEPAPATTTSPAERKKAVLAEQHRAVAFLDSRIRSGPADPRWSSEVQGQLAGSLEAGSGSSLRSVECGAALCRAEISHPNRQRLEHFVQTLTSTLHRNFQIFFERDGEVLATTVFIARDGQQIPNLAKELSAQRGQPPATD